MNMPARLLILQANSHKIAYKFDPARLISIHIYMSKVACDSIFCSQDQGVLSICFELTLKLGLCVAMCLLNGDSV